MNDRPGFFPIPPTSSALQLRDVMRRLMSVLDEENALLAEARDESLDPVIQKKSQLLLELMRAEKALGAERLAPPLLLEVHALKQAMQQNQKLLSLHLTAARDISDTIVTALRQHESDGTYGRHGAYRDVL
jgi:flagellar biosynthesis/type III secretory pathway chaperone